jgi:hypothetical protein
MFRDAVSSRWHEDRFVGTSFAPALSNLLRCTSLAGSDARSPINQDRCGQAGRNARSFEARSSPLAGPSSPDRRVGRIEHADASAHSPWTLDPSGSTIDAQDPSRHHIDNRLARTAPRTRVHRVTLSCGRQSHLAPSREGQPKQREGHDRTEGHEQREKHHGRGSCRSPRTSRPPALSAEGLVPQVGRAAGTTTRSTVLTASRVADYSPSSGVSLHRPTKTCRVQGCPETRAQRKV